MRKRTKEQIISVSTFLVYDLAFIYNADISADKKEKFKNEMIYYIRDGLLADLKKGYIRQFGCGTFTKQFKAFNCNCEKE